MAGASPRAKLREYERKRDFEKTPEPSGREPAPPSGGLVFVIQKHAASHLHFDLRLELDGVMKSWAVPKGPSLDPSVKRLAIQVEDHPMAYNTFEGTIPQGEYGGGTVMLWDRGTYSPEDAGTDPLDPERAIRRDYHKGRIDFTLHGDRLRGGFMLLRTRDPGGDEGKPQWLFIKKDDEFASRGADIVDEVVTSVESGRTMEEIAAGKGAKRVWHSNRSRRPTVIEEPLPAESSPRLAAVLPMLCETGKEVPEGDAWTFEPKLDGIRVVALATSESASLITRNGNDKAKQFPEIAEGLRELTRQLDRSLVLDGEIVGIGEKGSFLRFQALQGRMHVQDAGSIARASRSQPATLVAFDILMDGGEVLMQEPWTTRRARLESVLDDRATEHVRLGETGSDGEAIVEVARRGGWEGIIAKRVDSLYRPGKRSKDWIKLKLENQQEFVVGGWTEPRNARTHLGALLLGYYDPEGKLIYAGHTGTGFGQASLVDMQRRLSRLERKTSPFTTTPRTNEKAHWTTPKVVVQVRFNEWTTDGKLRQPVFLGVREDRDPATVVREPPSMADPAPPQPSRKAPRKRKAGKAAVTAPVNPVVEEIRALEKGAGSGAITLGRGRKLEVSNLRKVFFPGDGYTKGDLLAYYAEMADHILPWMEDRPLVLKRFPNGITDPAFYQQSAPDSPPPGVRVETLRMTEESEEQTRIVGGTLATLLYTVQLGAVSYDPWHSRVGELESADYTILDLDPGEGATFRDVVRVARWVREEMDALGLSGAIKTSGSSGIHIYLPLAPETPLEAATLIAQIVATRVATRHPKQATVERMVRKRPKGTIYVDYLQNILGKTVAGVYAVRAKPGATVSTPLEWEELTDDLDLREFDLKTVPARVREVGDLWGPAMRQLNSPAVLLAAQPRRGGRG